MVDAETVRALIRAKVAEYKSLKQAAYKLGVNHHHLGEILAGKEPPGLKLLKLVGVRRVIGYEVVCSSGADSGKMKV